MKSYIITVLFFMSTIVSAQSLEDYFSKTDAFLSKNVKNGLVDYKGIHSNPSDLNEILDLASAISVNESDANNYQAFWINAYNLSVIKGVVDNYPTKSPLDNAGFFDKTKHSIGGKKITLNDIEHKLLRAKFNDARFHFVLVCGAIGCPPLINKAYLPSTLNTQLDTQTKIALNGNFLQINSKKKSIKGSEILKWYKEDFTMNGTSEIDYINTFRNEKIPADYKLSYFSYNWKLNKQ
ncbi:MAG: DUF547 domain-containing protein [Winogradskyella sp.]|uniref:DUF547 domain-containing protein n=1 Tax=Winogradskyella sp. TaxID=1883156 RepID=UPI000F3F007E|nr:DUF547 domain-containing protein [Winogradskyella sp.]RNC84162.1 MAG: DUF547 domain-containing protein [Winogradskyella sp.]